MPRTLLLAVLAVVACAAARPPTCAAASLPLEVEVRAREFAPGEPVRVTVRAPEPLVSARGRFGGREIRLAPEDGRTPSASWTGWSLVGLDDPPGPAIIEITGRTAGGRAAAGARAVTVAAREFPVEHLTVAAKYVEPPADVAARLARERAALDAVYARTSPPPPDLGPFVPPVPGPPTSTFGKRRVFNGKPRAPHPGLDLRAAEGDTVRSAGAGTVVWADELYYSGNTVIVDHGLGLFTIYAHLSRIDVREGQPVRAGERLGLAGATGRVTGPHLHFGAKIGREPFDPRALYDPSLFD